MVRRRDAMIGAAALIALTIFDAAGGVKAGDETGNGAYCHWFRQQAMNTGDEYWWERWRRCIRGNFWD